MKRLPRVTVLLVNYNRSRDTIECLESLFRLDYPELRVVVCDNASGDGSLEKLCAWADGSLVPQPPGNEELRSVSWPPAPKPIRHRVYSRGEAEAGGDPDDDAPLTIVKMGDNHGFTGGNNTGFRYVLSRDTDGYVWVLNNDTVVAADSLAKLVDVARHDPTIGVVGARLLHYERPDELQAAGGGRITRWNGMPWPLTDRDGGVASPAHPRRIDYVHGASMLISIAALRTVGLFDDRYFVYSEEADWCLRMRDRGLRMAYAPDARVWHKEGLTMGRRSPFQDYLSVRNTLLLVHRFFTPFVPTALLYSAYRCFLPKLLRGEWERLAAIARAYRDFVRELPRGREYRDVPLVAQTTARTARRKAS